MKPTLNSTGIRTDLVARLIAAGTPAGARVFDSRTTPFEPGELPAICVFSVGGTEDRLCRGVLLNKHTERVQVTSFVTGPDEAALGAGVDTMADAVIDNLLGDPEWVSSFETVEAVKVDKWQADRDAKYALLAVTCTFEMTYKVAYHPTERDLESVYVTTEPTTPDGANVSERAVLGGEG